MTTLTLATKPEKAIYNALLKLGYIPGIDFIYQSQLLGAYRERGSTIADFEIFRFRIIISVLGFYYHYNRPDTEARDRLQHIALASQGYKVIHIDEADALKNARYYTEEALRGVDHSRLKNL